MVSGSEKHVARLKAELASFKVGLRQHAPGTMEYRNLIDRIRELESNIELFQSGRYSRQP